MRCHYCHRTVCGCPRARLSCPDHPWINTPGQRGPLEELLEAHQRRKRCASARVDILEVAR